MLKPVFDRVENIMGKGENTGYHDLSFFHDVFKWLFPQSCKEPGIMR